MEYVFERIIALHSHSLAILGNTWFISKKCKFSPTGSVLVLALAASEWPNYGAVTCTRNSVTTHADGL